jgi:PASTA domain-containing protein
MSLRLSSLLPRVFVVVIVALLATATITFAAETRSASAVQPATQSSPPQILLVPDVRGQAYVFAKSTLEEGGFAWRVTGGARGYAANTVTAQSPVPGTRVYDTGAPTVSLILRVNSRYPQAGQPESSSPFAGTPLRLVGVVAKTKPKAKPKVKPKHAVKTKPKTKPAVKPHAKPKPAPKPKPKPKPAPAKASRPPAFVVPGAKPEPADEIPLTTRAKNLDRWVSSHRSPTNDNVRYWLYQHAWIVTGARLGWWHGAQAVETLIAVDKKVERVWGIGNRSERAARAALAEVRAKSK